jgi:hypothetical protein
MIREGGVSGINRIFDRPYIPLDIGRGTTGIEKNPDKEPRSRYQVFCSGGHLLLSGSMESCLAAQRRFL